MNRTHLSAAVELPTANARRLCESGVLVIGALATILLLTSTPAAAREPSALSVARLLVPQTEPVILRPMPKPFPSVPRPAVPGPRCNGRPC